MGRRVGRVMESGEESGEGDESGGGGGRYADQESLQVTSYSHSLNM